MQKKTFPVLVSVLLPVIMNECTQNTLFISACVCMCVAFKRKRDREVVVGGGGVQRLCRDRRK